MHFDKEKFKIEMTYTIHWLFSLSNCLSKEHQPEAVQAQMSHILSHGAEQMFLSRNKGCIESSSNRNLSLFQQFIKPIEESFNSTTQMVYRIPMGLPLPLAISKKHLIIITEVDKLANKLERILNASDILNQVSEPE